MRRRDPSPPLRPAVSDALAPFDPVIADWFQERLGPPTPAQARAWAAIRSGRHTLLAAPTGSGKTLAAFLHALDDLVGEARATGCALPDETRVLYVSPLRALGNDIQKNLVGPLAELRQRDPSFPKISVLVRSGDTPASERARMTRRPPHVLVTTPESLYILLTSEGGRGVLKTVRSVVVDEIHAVIGSKRGAHLALSLARLDRLAGQHGGAAVQRVGLSATQKPLLAVADFLVGPGVECATIDEGHARPMDLSVELPSSPLETVLSHEVWGELHAAIAARVREHRTTIVFVNTRKLAERTARELSAILGKDRVTSHHSSLSKDRRLDAEERLKSGELDALVATASLELGIDIGDVDLVIQVGTTRSIATLLQRVGRSGHGVGRVPKGVLFPVSPDELVEAAALMLAVRRGELDRTPQPAAPLDVLAQQMIASAVAEEWAADELFALARASWPYRELERTAFDALLAVHSGRRESLLHVDETTGRVRATRRARIVAVTSGGAIPDKADYRVIAEPDGLVVGSVDEDFAIEASGGDVFQLGNMSWRILRSEAGALRVADAQGAPPTLPFWVGEAPARTLELCEAMGEVREHGAEPGWLSRETGIDEAVAAIVAEQLVEARSALGALPTQRRIIIERFPDDSGGTQLVVHSLFGGRINRAFGLALRKRFCRSFGFELQAAANEDSVLISLGPMHSFPLEEVFDYLQPDTVTEVLRQAVLDAPVFSTRWRWNVSRALLAPRAPGGKRLPPPIQRMRADDLLAAAFPDAIACGENLPPGDIVIPAGHPILDQTLDDCLREAMDIDGLVRLLEGLRDGSIERRCVERSEPSSFAKGALAIGPYGFLDDAGLEDRRTRAVRGGGAGVAAIESSAAVIDAEVMERVREEAWPDPRDASEVHEALQWMGCVHDREAATWRPWLAELAREGRASLEDGRWFAAGASREPLDVERGRLEALGPVVRPHDDPTLLALEAEGVAVRFRLGAAEYWCHRRLFARMQRYAVGDRRQRVRPVATAAFRTFLARWHGAVDGYRLEGPKGVESAIARLAGWEAAALLWEQALLPARVAGYRPEWLDQLGMGGRVAWGRLWGSGLPAVKATPISLFPRDELEFWSAAAGDAERSELDWRAERVLGALEQRGALFFADLERLDGWVPSDAERGLDELIARGLVSSDSFGGVRPLMVAPSRRRRRLEVGRWSLFRGPAAAEIDPETAARKLLRRYGVVFRVLLARERIPVGWRELLRALRGMELRGEVHGGRFVDGYAGEQFADPAAIALLKRAGGGDAPFHAADPLALDSVLVPGVGGVVPRTGAVAAPLGPRVRDRA